MISAYLKKVIANSPLTQYKISEKSGVEQSVLSRFMNGKCTMTIETADKLLRVFGKHEIHKLEVAPKPEEPKMCRKCKQVMIGRDKYAFVYYAQGKKGVCGACHEKSKGGGA